MPDSDGQTSSSAVGRGITMRAVAIGSLLVAGVSALVPYNDYIVGNTFLIGSYLPLALVLVAFVLLVLVNAPLHRRRPAGALRAGELATIFIMLLVGASVPGQGLLRTFIPALVAPFYFGQQNQPFWEAFTGLGLPDWMYPVESIADGRNSPVVQGFYGRLSAGESLPLAAWVRPLMGWGVFIGGMMLTFVSLAFLLRVQWGANERLPYPLAQLQLALIEPPPPGRALNRLFVDKGFWLAAAAVLLIHSVTALADYFPRNVTAIPLSYDFRALMQQEPWRFLPEDIKRATIFFTFVGVTYFIQSRTAFSLWSIWVITQLLTMQARVVQSDIPLPAWRDQHGGACLAYVVAIAWLGRGYWARIVRSFATRDSEHRDGRWALLGAGAGIGVMTGWLTLAGGVGLPATLLIVGIILVAHVTTARIVAETGMPFIRTLVSAQQVFVNLPARSLAGRDVFFAAMSTANGVGYNRESLLTFTQHGLRVGEGAGLVPRETGRLVGVIAWTLLLALAVGCVSSLNAYYGYAGQLGATGGEPTVENKHGLLVQPDETVVKPMQAWHEGRFARPPHTPWIHFLVGATVTAALQVLSWRLAWWPFVPVGYLVAGTYTFIAQAWFSIMLGWLAKTVVLRFGGATAYQRAAGVFIGLIFGEALAAGVWLMINMGLAWAGYDYHPVRFLPN